MSEQSTPAPEVMGPAVASAGPWGWATALLRGRRKSLLLRQPIMLRVLYALVPVLGAGVYFFGWRVLALLVACNVVGLATELLTSRQRNQPASMAVFVTCWLYALSLPPTTPYWVAAVGVLVAVLFGKEVYGGFGRNWCNPAIVGRAFVYVCFPTELTAAFVPVFRGWPGGLAQWSFDALHSLPQYLGASGVRVADAITAATPLLARRQWGYATPLGNLFLGDIGGIVLPPGQAAKFLAAGSIGEVSALIVLLAGAYLLVTRTANWRLMVGAILGAVLTNVLLLAFLSDWSAAAPGMGSPAWRVFVIEGAARVPPVPFTLFSGALLYGAVFMVTDPVSAPKKRPAMWAYAAFIGAMIVIVRWKAQFSGAVAFAILLGNMVGPLLDLGAEAWERRRARGGAQGSAPAGEAPA